jgi:hypothetical protein
MIDYPLKSNKNVKGRKANKPKLKRCVSPFKKKRIKTGKKQNRKDLTSPYSRSRNLSNQKVSKDLFQYDPMAYSSVMYKYHNTTAKKVNMKISQIRRNMMYDIKKQSEIKNHELCSLSKSAHKKKQKKKMMSRDQNFRNGVSIKKMKKKQDNIMTKFETFRKKNDSEQSNRIKGSIYETIKKTSKKIKNINTLDRMRSRNQKNRRNYSLTNKIPKGSAHSKFKKKRRNISSNMKKLNNIKHFKKITNPYKPNLNYKSKFPKNIIVNTAKSFFKHKPRDIKIKVQKEYNLQTHKNPKNSNANFIKSRYNSQVNHKKQTFYSSTKSNETLKIEAIENSLNVNLDSLTETMRNKSDLEFNENRTSNINQQLLEELKLSQMQNMKFTEIINDLQVQIEQLKKNQMTNFSFKNLSNRNLNPTVESGRNSD